MDRVDMNRKKQGVKVPTHLVVVALLSGGFTLVVSLIYVVLSSVALVFSYQCDDDSELDPESVTGSSLFMNILFRVYFLRNGCRNSIDLPENFTQADTIILLVIITLIFSILSLMAAIALITVIKADSATKYICIVAYMFVGICVASLVIDIALATLFGIDYGHLSEGSETLNYFMDTMMRLGAAFLMTMSLKGFVFPVVNMTLLVLLVIYTVELQQLLKDDEHSIHKIGAIHAYEQHQTNSAFIIDDDLSMLRAPRSPVRNPSMSEHSKKDFSKTIHSIRLTKYRVFPNNSGYVNKRRMYDRSESWQAGSVQGARPFSYLGEANRHVLGARHPPAPPVPEPDYSPPSRRLKSALKPSYM